MFSKNQAKGEKKLDTVSLDLTDRRSGEASLKGCPELRLLPYVGGITAARKGTYSLTAVGVISETALTLSGGSVS